MTKHVLIVGAGLGGLTTALRLSKRGYKVEIIEKNSIAGGRLNQLKKDGFTFDIGPSFFSMSYEFEEFAEDCNIKLPFKYYPLDPLYAVNFPNRCNSFLLFKDINQLSQQFKEYEPKFKEKFINFLNSGKQLYNDTNKIIIHRNFRSTLHFLLSVMSVNPKHIPKLFRTYWQQVSKYFSSEKVKEIISLVSFFLGRTPFDTPAFYTLLSYIEFIHDGYYNVDGGMYKIVEGLLAELKKENVTFHYNTEIINYASNGNNLENVIDNNGKKWQADIYVINADAALFRNKVFKRIKYSNSRLLKKKWTMAPLTFYLGIEGKIPNVNHHNYYLGNSYKEYSKRVYSDPSIVEKPYYYVNVLSASNPSCAPKDCESLTFVCPVPDLNFKPNWSDKEQIVQNIIKDFSQRIKFDITHKIVSKSIFTPIDWEEKFFLYRGSGLGLAHNFWQIGAFRPRNVDERFRNVFYVGASTVPGTGLPMVVISSKLVVKQIEKTYATI